MKEWEILPNGMLTEESLKRLSDEVEKAQIEIEENWKKPEMRSRYEKLMRLKSELKNK